MKLNLIIIMLLILLIGCCCVSGSNTIFYDDFENWSRLYVYKLKTVESPHWTVLIPVIIHHKLNGTEEFKPTDAFIVGIDPTHSLLPTTSPKIVLVSGAVANNFEPLLALFGALLSVGIILRIRIK